MRLLALAVLGLLGCGRLGFEELGSEQGIGPDGGIRGDDDGGAGGADGGGGTDGGGGFGPLDAVQPTPLPPNCFDVPCRQLIVDEANFDRDNNTWYPATTSTFVLDRYEVSVTRFRQFVVAGFGTRLSAPDAGDGAHPSIPSSGWQGSWGMLLSLSRSDFENALVNSPNATYTVSAGPNEQKPINGVTWYEAFAFCVWDGGRLPTVAEHEAAAFGGEQQRVYPWGSSYDASKVATGTIQRIASHSPAGDGRWGHVDIVGNADEWALDYFGLLPQPCNDCAKLAPDPGDPSPTRVWLGGSFLSNTSVFAQSDLLHGGGPNNRNGTVGFRCARERY